MARRSVLKGVASDLLTSFVSRNNDIEGYWAIGKLCRLAKETNVTRIQIDLLRGCLSVPSKAFGSMTSGYRLWVETLAGAKGLLLAECLVDIEFELFSKPGRAVSGDLAETPFRCSVTLVDDRKGVWGSSMSGICWPHDADRERRSSRADDPPRTSHLHPLP